MRLGADLYEIGTFAQVGSNFSRNPPSLLATIDGINRGRAIWVTSILALCALGACALIALASGAGKGGKPSLTGLEARSTGSGSGVVVSGYASGADSVLARYGRNCRILRRAAIAGNGRFRVTVAPGASRRRARHCNGAVAKRARGHRASASTSASGSGAGGSGAVRVIACAEGRCADRRVALSQSVGASSPGLAGGGQVTVAPGVTVRVPTAPPVPPSQPATRFVKADGSDSGSCSSAASPCKTFNRAYEVASPGEVVDVAAGTYPSQAVEYDSGKTSADDVYFRPAAGGSVKVGDIDAYGSHVTFMAMQAADTDIPYDGPAGVSDVTFWGMDGRNFTIDSGSQINVLGGDYGPASSCGGSAGGGNNGIRMNREEGGQKVPPTDILIWGVDIHDVQSYDLGQCHIECLIVGGGQNITVRGSRFWNCSIFDIFLQPFNGPISDVTLENNWFATPTGTNGAANSGRAVEFSGGGPWRNLLIRHNSVNTAINLNDGAASPEYENTRVIGNVAERATACYNGVVYRDNLWFDGSGVCDPSDVGVSGGPPFVRVSDHGDLDYHLTGGPAVDLVPPSVSDLADDIDGEARPKGSALDAGSDER